MRYSTTHTLNDNQATSLRHRQYRCHVPSSKKPGVCETAIAESPVSTTTTGTVSPGTGLFVLVTINGSASANISDTVELGAARMQ
jgi:hypothetical protein